MDKLGGLYYINVTQLLILISQFIRFFLWSLENNCSGNITYIYQNFSSYFWSWFYAYYLLLFFFLYVKSLRLFPSTKCSVKTFIFFFLIFLINISDENFTDKIIEYIHFNVCFFFFENFLSYILLNWLLHFCRRPQTLEKIHPSSSLQRDQFRGGKRRRERRTKWGQYSSRRCRPCMWQTRRWISENGNIFILIY